MHIGRKVKELVTQRTTLTAFAELLGKRRSVVYTMLAKPDLELNTEIVPIANLLDLKLDFFLDETNVHLLENSQIRNQTIEITGSGNQVSDSNVQYFTAQEKIRILEAENKMQKEQIEDLRSMIAMLRETKGK